MGDAILAVFGAPQTHEDDAERAVRAALLASRVQTLTLSPAAIPICRTLAATGDRGHLEQLLEVFREQTGGHPRPVRGFALGLVELLERKADRAARSLLDAEAELNSLGRRYDAACVAFDAASALDESGDASEAAAARDRARELHEPLGCVNPY